MLQLPVQPAYALSIHKVQALTIRHTVNGCLEGVFAHGQIYVLISRVTEPQHYHAVGLPPNDLLDMVARAWREAGFDVEDCLAKAVHVTKEWVYIPCAPGADPCVNVKARLQPKWEGARRVPLKLKSLPEILDPQPDTMRVLHGLLAWIDKVDRAAQRGEAAPPPQLPDGRPLFPEGEWWLTDLERRRAPESEQPGEEAPVDEEQGMSHGCESEASTTSWPDSDDALAEDSDASLPAGPRVAWSRGGRASSSRASATATTTATPLLSGVSRADRNIGSSLRAPVGLPYLPTDGSLKGAAATSAVSGASNACIAAVRRRLRSKKPASALQVAAATVPFMQSDATVPFMQAGRRLAGSMSGPSAGRVASRSSPVSLRENKLRPLECEHCGGSHASARCMMAPAPNPGAAMRQMSLAERWQEDQL